MDGFIADIHVPTWDEKMLKELERAFNKLKYADLAVDLKNPLLLEAMERAIRNPEDAWKAIKEAGDEITVAKDLAKSDHHSLANLSAKK